MLIFNTIQDLHPTDTYIKKLKSNDNNSGYQLDTNDRFMDGQTEGGTDGKMNRVNPVYPRSTSLGGGGGGCIKKE